MSRLDRFDGWIAGLGTSRGPRVVIGHWPHSPLGPFTDVMVEEPDGHRILLAPSQQVADFVAGTYRFDEVRITEVTAEITDRRWLVRAQPLELRMTVGTRPPLGMLLRAVPPRLATAIWWITVVDTIALLVLPGVRTRGSAGGGRQEYYAALDLRRVRDVSIHWRGDDAGSLAPVAPPVRFGFGSTPRTPSLVRVVTQVRHPH
jgi:hypothetical protein